MVERIVNGDFTDGLTGWSSGSACAGGDWQISIHDDPPLYCAISSFASGCITYLSQSVDLTNVNNLTFDARGWIWPDFCGAGWIRAYVDDTIVWESLINIANFTAQNADVSIFTGAHTIKFSVYGVDCGTRMDIMDVSAIATIPMGLADTPWPKFSQNNKNTGLSPYANTNHTLKWKYLTGGTILSSPAIAEDGTIYIGNIDKYLYAINPDGSLKWKKYLWYIRNSSPAIAEDGTIYIGVGDYLYAINPDSTVKWSYEAGDNVDYSSPTIAEDGTIYVGSIDDYLYAINSDGSLKWKSDWMGGNVIGSPSIADDGTVYASSEEGMVGGGWLYAFNPDGSTKWRYFVGDTGPYEGGAPSIADDGTVYVGSIDKYLYAINSDGTLKWRYLTGGFVWVSPSIGADGTVYFGSYDKYFYALNPDGTLKWRYLTGGKMTVAAIDSGGIIYFGSYDKYFYALNPDGTLKWRHLTGNYIIESSPAIGGDGTIYFGSYDKYIYAFGPPSGVAVGDKVIVVKLAPGQLVAIPANKPSVGDKVIMVKLASGQLVAFNG